MAQPLAIAYLSVMRGYATTDLRAHVRASSVDDGAGCWVWQLKRNKKTGYGEMTVKCRTRLAHRVAYEAYNGAIPTGMNVCHSCDNAGCVNPAHLFVATQKRNVADMYAKGRERPPHRNKTHCVHGHEYTPENTYWHKRKGDPRGVQRACRQCHIDKWHRRKRETAA